MSIGFWLFLWIVAGWAILFGVIGRGGATAPARTAAPDTPSIAPLMAASPPAASDAADAPVPDTYRPELLAAPRNGQADDLELIWGIGPRLAELLHSLGVFHFSQIASWTEMNLRWIDQNLGSFKGRAVRDKWIEQSAKLASGWRPDSSIGDRPA